MRIERQVERIAGHWLRRFISLILVSLSCKLPLECSQPEEVLGQKLAGHMEQRLCFYLQTIAMPTRMLSER